MKTSIFYYCAFAFVVLSGMLFGLDWQPATMSPMPPIQVVALPPPPPPKPIEIAAPIPAAPPVAVAPKPAAPKPVAPSPVVPSPVVQAPPKPLCDVTACAAAYRSFRESDCTFNPSFGPRQLCTKGVVPTAATVPPPPAAMPATPDAQPSIMQAEPGKQPAATSDAQPAVKCNVSACAAAYRTFTESDCTFMASGGQRKMCTR